LKKKGPKISINPTVCPKFAPCTCKKSPPIFGFFSKKFFWGNFSGLGPFFTRFLKSSFPLLGFSPPKTEKKNPPFKNFSGAPPKNWGKN
jgi:hypothetical protein